MSVVTKEGWLYKGPDSGKDSSVFTKVCIMSIISTEGSNVFVGDKY